MAKAAATYQILVVDDSAVSRKQVEHALEAGDYSLLFAKSGQEALDLFRRHSPSIVVTDWMMPDFSGLELCERIRADAQREYTYVIMLSAKAEKDHVVKGLAAGADDYLTKPFSFEVLLARLRARTRVGTAGAGLRLRFSDLAIDLETHEAWRGKRLLTLTRTEFSILECLMRAAGRVAPRQRLIESVWGPDREVGNNNLDVFMRFLRTKVDLPGRRRLIQTVRGVGYRLRESEE
jgi:DNA-binding response OmpR family regulator